MKNLNGDEKLEYLREKISKGKSLTSEDILALTLIPLMSGKESSSDRSIKSITLAEKIPEGNEKLQCLTLLYSLLDKFGDEKAKSKFKEVVSMTEIGKMIRDEALKEGIQEGIKEGKAEGKSEMLIKLLIKKFKSVPEEYKEKIRKLPEETIDVIATDIFEIDKAEEIEKYF